MQLIRSLLLSSMALAVTLGNVEAQSSERLVPGKTVISHKGESGDYRNIEVEAKLYEVYERWVEETYTWTEWECDYDVPGDGKGDWKGFFSSRRPQALADAIKGIGLSRAQDIVNARYFRSRPRSWEAFKREISQIQRDLDMKGLYSEVVVKYGEENYRNLGYSPDLYGNTSFGSGSSYLSQEGDGSSGDWKGFYNVPKSQKPAALSAAVRGIGLSTAEKIVNSNRGYFESKPRSWEAFKDEIKRIERELGIESLYENVVSRYGSDNKQNLGYGKSSSSPGKPAPQPPTYVCRLVRKTGTDWVLKKDERYVRSYRKNIDVSVSGAKLLAGETDLITVIYDGRSISFDTSRAMNSYTAVEDARDVYRLSANKRKQVAPNIQDLQFNLSRNSGNLYLNIKDARAEELIAIDSNYKLNVSFVLAKKAGRCSKDKVLVRTTQTLENGTAQIELAPLSSEAFAQGESYYIQAISFERVNSSFFSGSSAESKSIDFQF